MKYKAYLYDKKISLQKIFELFFLYVDEKRFRNFQNKTFYYPFLLMFNSEKVKRLT
jgi:hypothetical protein